MPKGLRVQVPPRAPRYEGSSPGKIDVLDPFTPKKCPHSAHGLKAICRLGVCGENRRDVIQELQLLRRLYCAWLQGANMSQRPLNRIAARDEIACDNCASATAPRNA